VRRRESLGERIGRYFGHFIMKKLRIELHLYRTKNIYITKGPEQKQVKKYKIAFAKINS
jgi:hypothetical protein